MSSSVKIGRPRSSLATKAILRTALELAHAGGISHATVERIALQSNVAKSTIYRRWPNASTLVMDAFLQDIGPLILYEPCPSIQETVRNTLQSLVDALAGKRGKLLRHLLGVAQFDLELQEAFIQHWITPRRQLGLAALKRSIDNQELSPNANPELILDMLYGALYYRLVVSFTPPDRAFVDELVDRVFHGLIKK